ncbi:MAG: hypothetical protein IT204_22170 [Fimbriimonadaceae bacterium]|nr:hypothetical protein [Fimbriimonadaceae bacterium]
MRLSWRRWSTVIMGAVLAAAAGGCGGGQGVPAADRVITGTVTETNFVVGADEVVEFVGDTNVQCATANVAGLLRARAATAPGAAGAGLTLQASGTVAVTGQVMAGDGQPGGPGQAGGDGGGVTIQAGGAVTLGVAAARQDLSPAIGSGSGGDGGVGATGAGGDGGAIRVLAAGQTITFHERAGLLTFGSGGDGGALTLTEDQLAGQELPTPLQNGGGDGGTLELVAADVAGLATQELSPEGLPSGTYLVPAESTIAGGAGGAAGAVSTPPEATAARTGHAVPAPRVRAIVERLVVEGSNGGDGWRRGGDGAEVRIILTRANGQDAKAHGGDGGNASDRYQTTLGQILGLVLPGTYQAGKGGDAYCQAAPGSPGSPSTDAGDGGRAAAVGGSIGRSKPAGVLANVLPVQGGRATALGGHGGRGGGRCGSEPMGWGGDGGKGGEADARGASSQGLPSGAAEATGGAGGSGGDGERTPGVGGSGGAARAEAGPSTPSGPEIATPGATGAAGTACVGPINERYSTATGGTQYNRSVRVVSFYERSRQAAAVTLGGTSHPLTPGPGQTLQFTADGGTLWAVTFAGQVVRYANPVAGGDVPAGLTIVPPAEYLPLRACWLDTQRDLLYVGTAFHGSILVWQSVSTMTGSRDPDRVIRLHNGPLGAITGDTAGDRLFCWVETGAGARELRVLDQASTRDGVVSPDRALSALGVSTSAQFDNACGGLAYDEPRDRLYAALVNAAGDPEIASLSNASTTNGGVTVSGRITGSGLPGLARALQVFSDADLLFAACTTVVSVWEHAGSLNGAVSPAKSESVGATALSLAVVRQ